jgi:hypothetical protein
MMSHDIVDEIIADLEPEQIPAEFISEAMITGFDGNEKVIRGDDLKEFLSAPFEFAVEARILLNIRKIRRAIITEVNAVYDEVNRLYALDFPDEK